MQYTETLANQNQSISYSSTDFTMFAVLKNLNYQRRIQNKTDSDHLTPIFLDEDVERYISLQFIQSTDNWHENDPEKMFQRENTRAKQCTPEDFGSEKEQQQYIEKWKGFSLFCPDFDQTDFQLQNKHGDHFTKYLTFEVKRCENTPENNNWCHEEAEIDEFLEKASIEIWTVETKVDMSLYDKAPVYHIMSLKTKKMLNIPYLQQTDALLDDVVVDSINSWFYVEGEPTFHNEYYNSASFVDRSEQWPPGNNKTLLRINVYSSGLEKFN